MRGAEWVPSASCQPRRVGNRSKLAFDRLPSGFTAKLEPDGSSLSVVRSEESHGGINTFIEAAEAVSDGNARYLGLRLELHRQTNQFSRRKRFQNFRNSRPEFGRITLVKDSNGGYNAGVE